MSQDRVMMDELRCGGCNYLLNPYAHECPKCGDKVDPFDQMGWLVRSAASTVIVLIWSLVIYLGAPIPPWTVIPVAIVAVAMVVRERSLFKAALLVRRKHLDELARMSGQFPAVKPAAKSKASGSKSEDAVEDDSKSEDAVEDDGKSEDASDAKSKAAADAE